MLMPTHALWRDADLTTTKEMASRAAPLAEHAISGLDPQEQAPLSAYKKVAGECNILIFDLGGGTLQCVLPFSQHQAAQ